MLRIYRIQKHGFQESVKVGDVLTDSGTNYIIVRIGEMKVNYFDSSKIEFQIVAQKNNLSIAKKEYEEFGQFEKKYKQEQIKKDHSVFNAGKFIYGTKEKDCVIQVVSIDSMRYEFTDVVIRYNYKMVLEWSKQEIDNAFRSNRLSKFKVIN